MPTAPPNFAFGLAFIVDDYPDSIAAVVGGPSLRIPIGEGLVAVSGDRAASVIYRDAGGIRGAGGSTIIVREISTGHEVVRVDRPEQVATMVFAGGSLYFAGHPVEGATRDTGVDAINLADGTVREVIAPGPWPVAWSSFDLPTQYAQYQGTGDRWQLRVSPTGSIVASPACGPATPGGGADHCVIDVIDTATDTVTRPITDTAFYLRAVSDTTLYAAPEGPDIVAAFDRATGRQRWQVGGGAFWSSYATSQGAFIAAWVPATAAGPRPRMGVAALDATTGAMQMFDEVSTDPGLTLWPELSDDHYAVASRGGSLLEGAFRHGLRSVSADLIDLTTGQVFPYALTIPSPITP